MKKTLSDELATMFSIKGTLELAIREDW